MGQVENVWPPDPWKWPLPEQLLPPALVELDRTVRLVCSHRGLPEDDKNDVVQDVTTLLLSGNLVLATNKRKEAPQSHGDFVQACGRAAEAAAQRFRRRRRKLVELIVDLVAADDDVTRSADAEETRAQARRIIEALPKGPLRRVLEARYLEDRSVAEVAAELGVDRKRISHLTFEALKQLRDRFGPGAPSEGSP